MAPATFPSQCRVTVRSLPRVADQPSLAPGRGEDRHAALALGVNLNLTPIRAAATAGSITGQGTWGRCWLLAGDRWFQVVLEGSLCTLALKCELSHV